MRISEGHIIDNLVPGNYALDLKFIPSSTNLLGVQFSDESSIAVVDVTVGKELSRHVGKERISNFSVGSNLMAICSCNGNVEIFDVNNFPHVKVSSVATGVPLMATDLSRDDLLLVCGSDDVGLSVKQRKSKRKDVANDDLSDSSDTSDSDISSYLIFTDLRSGKCLGSYSECHSDAITSVSFKDGSHDWLMSGGADGLACSFDLRQTTEDEALQQSWNCETSVAKCGWFEGISRSACYSVTDDGKLLVWDAESGDEQLVVRDAKQHESLIKTAAQADINRILVGCFPLPVDESIGVVVSHPDGFGCLSRWQLGSSKPSDCVTFHSHRDSVRCAAWSQNLLATGGEDGVVAIHNVQLDRDVEVKKRSKMKGHVKRPY